MKVLVAFYSRTGTTKEVAARIAAELAADQEEIVDQKNRQGVLGFIGGGKDATLKRLAKINDIQKPPEQYDVVVIGTPVWANTMAPAIRTYLTQQKDSLPRLAFFVTTGSSGIDRTFEHMAELSGKPPLATLGLRQRDVQQGDFTKSLREFIGKITAGV